MRRYLTALLSVFALLMGYEALAVDQYTYKLAQETRQPLAVVDDLVRKFPSLGARNAMHRVVLKNYTSDRVSKAQAMRCNGHMLASTYMPKEAVRARLMEKIARDCGRHNANVFLSLL